jgi:hypothetical protein
MDQLLAVLRVQLGRSTYNVGDREIVANGAAGDGLHP